MTSPLKKPQDWRIAFYVYPTAFQNPGGGEVQLLKTKEYLEKEGIAVKLFDPWKDRLKDFDILHTFGSVKDCLPMMEAASKAGIKNVLSTICWYSWKSSLFTYPDLQSKALSSLRYAVKVFAPFVSSKRKRMMGISDLLLPNSQSEAAQLKRFFCIPESKIFVVPNAVDESFAQASPNAFEEKYGFKNFILCVGRIEPRKNQLGMVRALKGITQTVLFIGDCVSHYQGYYDQCRKEASSNIHFLGGLPHGSDLLRSAYGACNTFLLASWLETPGLAALEAGLAGAKIVITQEGAAREYFSNDALYVDPKNLKDIKDKTLAAFSQTANPKLKNRLRANYLWKQTALKTIEAYQRALNA
ncbi:MAG: glycosyltransferase [Candidatus Omnitrophica bacterium]|nr:glycosyltransferase [Candidatus Omnitrophota bacterium]